MQLRSRWILPAFIIGVLALVVTPLFLQSAKTADPYAIEFSRTSDHADSTALAGATVSGVIFPFTAPDTGVSQVTFSLNDQVVRTENNAPFDFMGGDASNGQPWDTNSVNDGQHTISAELLMQDGTRSTITATFTVANSSTPPVTPPTATPEPELTATPEPEPTATTEPEPEATPPPGGELDASGYSVAYSLQNNRTNPAGLDGATVSGIIYPFTTPDQGVENVTFALDGKKTQVEGNPPYDFRGGTATIAHAWDTTSVADGVHSISAAFKMNDGTSQSVTATFTVANQGGSPPPVTATPAPVEPTPTPDVPETQEPEPTATPSPTPPQGTTSEPTLLRSYYSVSGELAPDGFENMKYRPRQFASGLNINGLRVDNAGSYSGWDVFNPHHRLDTSIRIELNRQATVAVVWMTTSEGPPSWLSSWQSAGTVSIGGKNRSVYRKTLGAGSHDLGGFRYGNEPYLVLFAEANGAPSAPPATPPGKSQQPNQQCQDWVHDLYMVTGPDGEQYRTWHPQNDPVYSCSFGHEHGNDPGSVAPGYQPMYGYINRKHNMPEANHGVKTYAFRDQQTGLDWVITQHQGTSTRNVMCGRFHAVNVAVFQNGQKMADLSMAGDFGTSRFAATNEYMTPPECPNQGSIESNGLRRVPKVGDGYTPYIMNDTFQAIGLRMNVGFLTTDGRTACIDKTCASLTVNESNTGSRRRLQVLDSGLSINRAVSASSSGVFYTDSTGSKVVSAGTHGAVQQFIAPGFSADLRVARADRDGAKRNGMWAYNGEFEPLIAASDVGDFKGSNPLMPLWAFGGEN